MIKEIYINSAFSLQDLHDAKIFNLRLFKYITWYSKLENNIKVKFRLHFLNQVNRLIKHSSLPVFEQKVTGNNYFIKQILLKITISHFQFNLKPLKIR